MINVDNAMANVRQEVLDFIALGPLPKESEIKVPDDIERYVTSLTKISGPVSREEALLLASSFGPDSCFGVAWTLLHLIETTSGGIPVQDFTEAQLNNEWIDCLAHRVEVFGQARP